MPTPIWLHQSPAVLTFARAAANGLQWWSLGFEQNATTSDSMALDAIAQGGAPLAANALASDAPAVGGLGGVHTVVATDRIASNTITVSLGITGIVPFYIIIWYGAFRTVRSFTAGSRYRLFLDELPDARDLVDLCDGVYIARRSLDLMRETELFETIIRLYRSPEALLSLTGGELKHE